MENQTVEWKSKWEEKYLKWICGFANAQGGTIEIGKNDDGNIVPIKELKNSSQIYQTTSIILWESLQT
ncbi:MAG: ATP-binding protein [Nitrososphaerota archaeon]|nr:ATP-binding protein [Nitrososphaerota archaeon]